MANLFGETPGAIRQAMMNEQLKRASVMGSLGPGGHGALGGLMAGQGIVGLLGAQEDPRLQQAQALQSIEQQIEQEGLEPGTRQFTQRVSQLVGSRLGIQAQTQAMEMALDLEKQRAEVDLLRDPPEVASTRNRKTALRAIGMSEESASVIAPIKEVAIAVLKQELSPAQADQIVERALWATNGDEKEARRIVRKKMEGGGPLVQITNEGKVAQISAETRARAETTAAVAEEVSREQAGPIMQEYAALLRSAPSPTDIGAFAEWVARVTATAGPASQAFAKLRNPGRITDEDVKQAQDDLPGIGSVLTGQVENALKPVETSTGIRFKSAPTAVPKRFKEGQTATNPKTGERLIFRDGAWQKL